MPPHKTSKPQKRGKCDGQSEIVRDQRSDAQGNVSSKHRQRTQLVAMRQAPVTINKTCKMHKGNNISNMSPGLRNAGSSRAKVTLKFKKMKIAILCLTVL